MTIDFKVVILQTPFLTSYFHGKFSVAWEIIQITYYFNNSAFYLNQRTLDKLRRTVCSRSFDISFFIICNHFVEAFLSCILCTMEEIKKNSPWKMNETLFLLLSFLSLLFPSFDPTVIINKPQLQQAIFNS